MRQSQMVLLLVGGSLLLFGGKVNRVPGPTPDPTPGEASCVYLIHESADGSQVLTDLKADATWKQAIEAKGVRWMIADDDAAEAGLPNVVAIARRQGLPAIVWVDKNGVGKSRPCPLNAADMLVLMREIGAAE